MNYKKKNNLFKIIIVIMLLTILANYKNVVNNHWHMLKRIVGINSIEKKNKVSVPILMYHSVSDKKRGMFTVDRVRFKNQMKYLKDNEYNTLSISELYEAISENKFIPKKSVVITFDDGYQDNYDNAYPILKEYGLKATIFVITDYIADKSFYMSLKELIEMEHNGIDIESHTTRHQKLDKLPYDKQLTILMSSKECLEKKLNKKVKYIAYPFGRYNEETIKAAKEAAYNMAVTTKFGILRTEQDLFRVKRVCIPGYINMQIFRNLVS